MLRNWLVGVAIVVSYSISAGVAMLVFSFGAKYGIAVVGLRPGLLAGVIQIAAIVAGALVGARIGSSVLPLLLRRVYRKELKRGSEIEAFD